MIDYQRLLNEEQYDVVTNADGPCLVLAGAGSGKTRTLVFRVAYLMECGVRPENILLVTFTNKAAREMLSRVEQLLGFKPDDFFGGTFHHIANRILRRQAPKLGYKSSFNILDENDSASLIKKVMADMGLNIRGQNFPKASVVEAVISFARNTSQDVRGIAQENFGYADFVAEKIEEISARYDGKKRHSQVMDFDDLLVNWLRLLQQFPNVCEYYSKQFEYILVDEYQDTNAIQAEIIKELSAYHNNVLVVGDDSQSIYSFRAADVRNILNFPKLFPATKIFKIETNYRSTPQILDLANDIISHNVEQYEKTLKPDKEGSVLPVLIAARDDHQQAVLIARRIMELFRDGVDYNSISVLYRATYQSAEIQLELSKQNIPYVVRGGMRYFEQAHIKDVMSYLRVLANFQDELAWRRLLMLHDGIGEKRAEAIIQAVIKLKDFSELMSTAFPMGGQALMSWEKIIGILRRLSELIQQEKNALAAAVELIMAAGYEEYLKNNFENYRDRLDDINQLMNFVAMYGDLEKLLADVTLSENFRGEQAAGKQSVVLSTIHQAKGLEWPVVFIAGLRDGNFPHYKSLENPAELEEERRLFYVAVTRAKDELNMIYPVRSFSYKFGEMYSKPSMFIRELDKTKYMTQGYHPFDDNADDEEKIIRVE